MTQEDTNDQQYVSTSSIDKPPREEKEPDQKEMFEKVPDEEGAKKEMDGNPDYLRFGVELTLKLKRGRVYTIPLLAGEYTNSDIVGLLELALKGRKNRAVIDSILDVPEKVVTPESEQLQDGKYAGHPEHQGSTEAQEQEAAAAGEAAELEKQAEEAFESAAVEAEADAYMAQAEADARF